MNRELRRMQEKAEKKGDPGPRRRGPRKVAKSEKPKNNNSKSKASKSTDDSGNSTKQNNKGTKRRGRLPNNRFTGILGILTAFFVLMQSASEELVQKLNTSATPLDYVFHALSYLLFGYFINLWLSRRGNMNAMPISFIFGFALLAGVEIGKWFNFNIAPNPILIGLAVVGLIAGVVLARFVFKMSERYAN